jgi:hypothetical protein
MTCDIRAAESGFSPAPAKGGPAKYLYAKSQRRTVSCRVTWALAERDNLYSQ